MIRQNTLLNKEIDDFFDKKFPLKQNSFKDEEDIFKYYLTTEKELTKALDEVLSKIKELPFKTKEFARYILKEHLIASFEACEIGKSISKKIYSRYEDIRNEVLKKASFKTIKDQRNINEIISFLTKEIIDLEIKFYNILKKDFSKGVEDFPVFLIDKFNWLIKDKYLTKASSQGINISKMVYNEIKNKTLDLFEKIFVNKTENMFLSKKKDESYKKYLDLIMICNKNYFKNLMLKIFFPKILIICIIYSI